MTRRVTLLVYVDLDDTPGAFHTQESAANNVHGILDGCVPHYNPQVSLAPTMMQPRVESDVVSKRASRSEALLFERKEDAESVLEILLGELGHYGTVTLATLYATRGITSNYLDHRWGWKNPLEHKIDEDGEHFRLNLPDPAELY